VVLADAGTAERLGRRRVKITGSAVATDALALQDRRDMLRLDAVEASTARALAMAGRTTEDVDFFELHDAFTIMSILSLEAAGFAPKGEGYRLAAGGGISLTGRIPICTMGGLKARGHPVGATGVYQAAEAVLQLEGRAGDCQVAGARVGLIQNIGGSGATVVTHVLEAD
jgi:acetyl-CoA C-acetyltransferase